MERITWDQFFMAQSHLLAMRSTCTRLSVGSILVRDQRIIAGGYNGSISGGDHCIEHGCYVVDNHCVRTIHSEMNALLQCAKYGIPVSGATIYVTHFPCLPCSKALIQAGIERVLYAEDYRNSDYAIELFAQAGVITEKIPFDERSIDFASEGKFALFSEMLKKMQALGATDEELDTLSQRVNHLFGK